MEIKKIIEGYKERVVLGFEQYDYPILYIGYNTGWDDYGMYTNYSRAIPDYIDVIKEYEDTYIHSIEEVCKEIKNLKAILQEIV